MNRIHICSGGGVGREIIGQKSDEAGSVHFRRDRTEPPQAVGYRRRPAQSRGVTELILSEIGHAAGGGWILIRMVRLPIPARLALRNLGVSGYPHDGISSRRWEPKVRPLKIPVLTFPEIPGKGFTSVGLVQGVGHHQTGIGRVCPAGICDLEKERTLHTAEGIQIQLDQIGVSRVAGISVDLRTQKVSGTVALVSSN